MRLLIPALLCAATAARADVTLLDRAAIITMDAARPRAEAMVFDEHGKILALGARDELAKAYPHATELDAHGATVVPGLIDAHGHLLNLGLLLTRVDLRGARSKAEVIERLKALEARTPRGEWLLGRGWDQNLWPEKTFPTAADLDAAFPDRPVWIERVDGHAHWANSVALRRSKRDLDGDWQPDGGRIERKGGKPTGVFVDAAEALIDDVVPLPGPAQTERALKLAFEAVVRVGLTGVHDPGISLDEYRVMGKLADRGEIPIRVYAMADGDSKALAWLCENGPQHHRGGHLEFRALKIYADGSLGSRSAALEEDYADDPGNRGLEVTAPEAIEKLAARARGCKLQVATHAIGDRANRSVLDAYAKALPPDEREAARWRIEHAQIVAVEDIPRFAAQHVIASMQPTHATSDMAWAGARLGPRRLVGAYAWRAMRDAGVRLAFGSDFVVESIDPRLGLYAAVTRADADGKPPGGWRAEQKLTAYEALRGFTLDAAYAGFAEHEVGSLEVGKRADFVLLDADPLVVEPARLRELKVIATYVDGKAVSSGAGGG